MIVVCEDATRPVSLAIKTSAELERTVAKLERTVKADDELTVKTSDAPAIAPALVIAPVVARLPPLLTVHIVEPA